MGDGAVRARFRSPAAATPVDVVLWEGDPVVDLQAADLLGDVRPEIAFLTAGARERLCLLSGCTAGGCAVRCVYEQPPTFGFTRLLAEDLEGDGRQDLLLVNGDNTDSGLRHEVRPYHGIRLLRNRGDFQFEEVGFLPLPGASMAVAEDLDQDGDRDIAAVSAYPDRRLRSFRSFVIFEEVGPFPFFVPRSLPSVENARWIGLAAGDLDGDGDVDLALGGLRAELGPLATGWADRWLGASARTKEQRGHLPQPERRDPARSRPPGGSTGLAPAGRAEGGGDSGGLSLGPSTAPV